MCSKRGLFRSFLIGAAVFVNSENFNFTAANIESFSGLIAIYDVRAIERAGTTGLIFLAKLLFDINVPTAVVFSKLALPTVVCQT